MRGGRSAGGAGERRLVAGEPHHLAAHAGGDASVRGGAGGRERRWGGFHRRRMCGRKRIRRLRRARGRPSAVPVGRRHREEAYQIPTSNANPTSVFFEVREAERYLTSHVQSDVLARSACRMFATTARDAFRDGSSAARTFVRAQALQQLLPRAIAPASVSQPSDGPGGVDPTAEGTREALLFLAVRGPRALREAAACAEGMVRRAAVRALKGIDFACLAGRLDGCLLDEGSAKGDEGRGEYREEWGRFKEWFVGWSQVEGEGDGARVARKVGRKSKRGERENVSSNGLEVLGAGGEGEGRDGDVEELLDESVSEQLVLGHFVTEFGVSTRDCY
eukprot:1193273-Prorocentrum_minimum.AAC.2